MCRTHVVAHNVIPDKGNYLASRVADAGVSYREKLENLLVTGGDDPLRPHLAHHLARAEKVDIVAAFIKPSGLQELWTDIIEALERRANLRVLTGDYLGITDPDALVKLLDLRTPVRRLTSEFSIRRRPIHNCLERFAQRHTSLLTLTGPEQLVGSSNLSRSALADGVEWNYQVIESRDAAGFRAIRAAYQRLFTDPRRRS